MKINHLEGGKAAAISDLTSSTKSKTQPVEKRKVDVSASTEIAISDKAKLMKSAFETAQSAPDIRWEKVNALKSRIQQGQYRVDSESVAERLLQEHLNSDFGKNNL